MIIAAAASPKSLVGSDATTWTFPTVFHGATSYEMIAHPSIPRRR
jgi:hypothetical protein